MDIRAILFQKQDTAYAAFQAKLIPNLPPERIIGVRLPELRRLARQVAVNPKSTPKHEPYYYEEFMVWGMQIGYAKLPIEKRLELLADFIPRIDNWSLCDSCCATYKFTKAHLSQVWEFLQPYVHAGGYQSRFAVVMLLQYYLQDAYIDRVLSTLSAIESDDYYVNMAVAWALATAYVQYPERVETLLTANALSPWVQNKTIQKLCESYRIDDAVKRRLKGKKRSTV